MYESFFCLEKEKITHGLLQWNAEGKRVAVWGAGRKGEAFLRMYDSDCNLIKAVFDKNTKKYGTRMSTGHRIQDYRYTSVDIIMIINSEFQMETRAALALAKNRAAICCIDDVLFGGISLHEALRIGHAIDGTLKRKVKIAAIVILYRPKNDVLDCIKSYYQDVDRLYLYDNSPASNECLFNELLSDPHVCYFYAGENQGIGQPINRAAAWAKEIGCDWLVSFDQDSKADKDMITRMRSYVESDAYDRRVGIVAPMVHEPVSSSEIDFLQYASYVTYMKQSIQSGMMHQIDILQQVGGYNEALFIDEVDFEFCARCRLAGYYILRVNHALLYHQYGGGNYQVMNVNNRLFYVNKYTPDRYYYICRNLLYCEKMYKIKDRVYAEFCRNWYKQFLIQVQYDVNYAENIAAIHQAKRDAEQGILGKRE